MLERVKIVFQKEVIDNLRDRRALSSTLLGTLIGPALMLLLFFVIGRTFSEQTEKPLELPVVGAEHAPNLIAFLQQNNVELLPPPEDPEAQVRVGDYDVVLVIPPEFGENLGRGIPATVRLVVDESRQSSSVAIERAERLLRRYSDQVAALRLIARGVSPTVLNPLTLETVDVATPQSHTAQFLNMMPYFIIFSVFLGGMYLAIDTTAGERERGSLEPLLINPIPRRELVLGKLAAIALFTVVTVLGTLVAFGLLFRFVPLEEFIGVRVSLDVAVLVAIFLISLPMVLLAAALQMIISAFSRTFKEAQSYLSFLPLVPALPGMFLAFVPVKANLWMMLIPTFGQQLIINQLMRQEPVSALNVLISALVTLVLAVALVLVVIRLYQRERILFGRSKPGR
jgi:sodium transport system permease protein